MDTQNDSLEKEIWPFFGIYIYFKPFTDLLCQAEKEKMKRKTHSRSIHGDVDPTEGKCHTSSRHI